jgi:regulator of protease activity HflC (stomatin/prohibitin superfamily)
MIEGGKASSDGDGYSVHLRDEDYIWVDLGGITVEAFLAPVPKRVLVPISETLDFTVLNIFLVLFFLGALFVIAATNRELEGDEYADELSSSEARIAKLIIKPPEVQKNPFLEKLAQQKEKQSGEMSAKHRGDEGEAGRKDAPKRNAHMAPQGKPNEKDQARMLTNRIFGGKGGGLSTVFGSNGLGGELTAAMGGLFGASAGDSKGFGGLGLRGTGGGGGGVGDTIGIGTPVVLESISIGNLTYPEAINQEIQRKLAAEQDLERIERELQIAAQEAEIMVTNAQGRAAAQRAVSETLTPLYVQHEMLVAFQALSRSPRATIVVAPIEDGSSSPVLVQLPP